MVYFNSYSLIKEARKNKDGTADHSTWRNYDDLNEFFWFATSISSVFLYILCQVQTWCTLFQLLKLH